MKILITGGAGFVGSNLAKYFLGKGHEVTVFDNLSRKGVKKNLPIIDEAEVLEEDLRNFDAVKEAVSGKDWIFHCAGQTAVTTSLEDPREDFNTNARGTLNLLEAARKSDKNPSIVYCSTNKVYGNNVNEVPIQELEERYDFEGKYQGEGIPEDFPTDADEHTPYGVSKYAGELYMRDYAEIYGLNTISNRMSCIYGPHQYGNEDQGWVAHFTISSIFDKPLTIYGDGKQIRDILFVKDLVRLFEKEAKNADEYGGNVYNVGGGSENTISLLELLEILSSLRGKEINPDFDDWRPADQKVYYSDISKASDHFDWKPKVSKEEGVKRLFNWVEDNKDNWTDN